MHYYQHHIGDFRSGTINMTRLERWIYRDMLDMYYDTEKPLIADMDALFQSLGVRTEEEKSIVRDLLRFKFKFVDGAGENESGYINQRCDGEIVAYRAKAKTASNNGKLGGRPVKDPLVAQMTKLTEPSGFLSGSNPVAIGKQEESGLKTNQEPITNNHKPVTSKDIEPTPKRKRSAHTPAASVAMFKDIDLQLVADFEMIRKAKRQPITLTAMLGIEREAMHCGLSFADAVVFCCENGWGTFREEWYRKLAAEKVANSPIGKKIFGSMKDHARKDFFDQLNGDCDDIRTIASE